jgi:hypothetical protein
VALRQLGAINLGEKEQGFLVELLIREILSMRDESRHTEDCPYREFLKERENFIGDLLRKLKESRDSSRQVLTVLRPLNCNNATHRTRFCPTFPQNSWAPNN